MRTYQLKDWKIQIENRSNEQYDFVCDEKNLIISDKSKEYITFVEVNQKDNLVLQKLPYFVEYKFYSEEKCLSIIILSDKFKKGNTAEGKRK